jgi:hypothetical protein
LHGPMRRLGCLVFADDPVAADATCCRLMGIDPGRVRHLQMASPLGNLDMANIEQRGEGIERVMQRFDLLSEFAHLRAWSARHCVNLGIPAKLNGDSRGKPNGIQDQTGHHRERSDAGISVVQEVFGFVKEKPVRSAAKEGCL